MAHVVVGLLAQHTRGHGHDEGAGLLGIGQLADGRGGLESAHLGHVDVHEHQIPFFVPDLFEGHLAVFGLADGHLLQFRLEGILGDDDIERVVLGDEDADGADFTVGILRVVLLGDAFGPQGGQGKAEGGAFTFDTLHPDDAALEFHNLLGDAEAEAGAPEFPRLQLVSLVEALEDLLLLVVRDADARVLHADHEPFVVGLGRGRAPSRKGGEGSHFCPQGDATFQRELDGVADEVDEDLVEAAGVAHQVGGQVVGGVDGEGEVLLLR